MPWVKVRGGCSHRVVGRGLLGQGEAFDASDAEMASFGNKLDVLAAPDATDGARALAEEHGIVLFLVRGSGDGGRILKADVEAYMGA